MDIALPSFILGYHGCDLDIAEQVFAGRARLKPSRNKYDWLGDGIYFWEHNPQRAYEFALELSRKPRHGNHQIQKPAVVGAVIDLGFCLNLLNSRFTLMLQEAYDTLLAVVERSQVPLPENKGGSNLLMRNLDCAVIRTLHQKRADDGKPSFDTVRAAFFEGEPLYKGAGFAAKNHIQLCVRDHRQIIGYFRPLDEHGKPLVFD